MGKWLAAFNIIEYASHTLPANYELILIKLGTPHSTQQRKRIEEAPCLDVHFSFSFWLQSFQINWNFYMKIV